VGKGSAAPGLVAPVLVSVPVGVAGLPATLTAIELGRDVALANKETLAAAGALVIPAAHRSGSRLLPVDSEHSGVWQCLRSGDAAAAPGRADGVGARAGEPDKGVAAPGSGVPWPPLRCRPHVSRVVLTASGGPFRTWSREATRAATPEQALRHPTWQMGPKVTIDSASLMNKGLELIEAHWLFGLEPERLGAVIHPQSIVHALVEHADGSVIAQLGSTDMRTPIMHALVGAARPAAAAPRLDLAALKSLEFAPWDPAQFPAVALAVRAMERGGTAGAALNGANEEAVLAFLGSREGYHDTMRTTPISFGEIVPLVEAAMDEVGVHPLTSLGDVLDADSSARLAVRTALARRGTRPQRS